MGTPAHPIAGSDDTAAFLATAPPTSPRDTFALALAALGAALELIHTVGTELPTLPSDPDGETVGNPDWSPCCAAGDLRVITVGLEQWCRIDVVNGKWNASTNGWNDMDDMTGPEYVQCARRRLRRSRPAVLGRHVSTDRGAARGNLTHFAVPEAREMLFDEMPSCPAYGGLSFDGIAVNADDQLYLIVRTPGARVYMGPDLSTVARRTQIIVVALIHGRVIHPEKGPAIAAWLRECWDSTFAEMQAAPKQ